MHEGYVPHCGSCEHFILSFRADMVIEWGYCEVRTQGQAAAFRTEIEKIRREVEAGSYGTLLARAGELGLFIPTVTSCTDFKDAYPI